ncbi:MAG: hypothetical protein A3A73_05070 [Omnitrophica bacterium RIFCSPLOWO2_01_FULL_50_24]|nr:MAG: hypothetical protein A3A73_05070 [Omnitrophica bacterium RIFCSPLOWO2_01_FULL_50_24]
MNISVIIPTFNEETTIERTLKALVTDGYAHEVIVVDGGSTDKTVRLVDETAAQLPPSVKTRLRLIYSQKGRAVQMNEGARCAAGDVFLFLHADTTLPADGLKSIGREVTQGARAGRFRMKFDDPNWLLNLYSAYTRFHAFSYGDQGFFAARDLFREVGGFRTDVPFEDIDFYRRVRNVTKPVIIAKPVTTSARRFRQFGFFKQKGINIWLVGLHALGFDVAPIKKRIYPDFRS